jgi:hypothetical protein
MQIFSFCMAVFGSIFYDGSSESYGAPEEIRTPDPQIRSLGRGSARSRAVLSNFGMSQALEFECLRARKQQRNNLVSLRREANQSRRQRRERLARPPRGEAAIDFVWRFDPTVPNCH